MIAWTAKDVSDEVVILSASKNSKAFAEKIKNEFLNNNYGFVICDFKDYINPLKQFQETINHMGKKMPQNINKDLMAIVENTGLKMSEGGRYHKSNDGGSLHTDCPQWPNVPDYIALYCINSCPDGGNTKLISALSISNIYRKSNPNLFEELRSNYHFDKRGEYSEKENRTTYAPIFSLNNQEIKFRFLDKYIESGHRIANSPLNKKQKRAINKLKAYLEDKNLTYTYKLKPKQALICNNHIIAHGRDSFLSKNRKLIRYWIKE